MLLNKYIYNFVIIFKLNKNKQIAFFYYQFLYILTNVSLPGFNQESIMKINFYELQRYFSRSQ